MIKNYVVFRNRINSKSENEQFYDERKNLPDFLIFGCPDYGFLVEKTTGRTFILNDDRYESDDLFIYDDDLVGLSDIEYKTLKLDFAKIYEEYHNIIDKIFVINSDGQALKRSLQIDNSKY